MKINNKKIAILFLLISLVLLTSCVVSATDNSNGTSTGTQEKVNTPETTTTHSDDSTQSTSTQEQTSSHTATDTNNQVSSDTQKSLQSTSQSSSSSNTQTTTKESSSSTESTNLDQSTTQSTTSQSSTQNVSTNNSVSTQSVNTEKQLSQEESNSNNQTTTISSENSQNNTQINSVDSSQLADTNKDLKTASYTASDWNEVMNATANMRYSGSTSGTIELISGVTYRVVPTLTWASSGTCKTLNIYANGATFDGKYNSAFAIVYEGYTLNIYNAVFINFNYNSYYNATIYNNGGTVNIYDSTFVNNTGCLILNSKYRSSTQGSVTLSNCKIGSNTGSSTQGVIQNYQSIMTIKNCVFSNYTTGTLSTLLFNNGGTMSISGTTFSNNANTRLIENSGGTMTVSNSVFTSNSARPGGVFYNDGTLTITSCNFTSNKASYSGSSGQGGVIYNEAGSVTVSQSIFLNNEASSGKVLYIDGGSANFNNNTFNYTYDVTKSSILYKAGGSLSDTNNRYRLNAKETTISINNTSANTNESKTFTAYIKASDNSIPTGSVKISIDGSTITQSISSNGAITFSHTFKSPGTYSVTISYAETDKYDASSKTFTVSVSTVYKDTYITTSSKTATVNKTTNLYGYIKASDNSIPSGSVTITVNGKSYTSSIGSDGYVHISYTFVNYGNYSVTISYAGSGSYRSSSSTFYVNIPMPTSSTVSSYTELYNTIQTVKTYTGSGTYTINLKDGSYKITNTINWGSTKGVKNLVINGNGVNIYGSSQKQFMNIATGYTVTINNLGIINGNATNGGSIYNGGNLTLNNCVFNNSKAKDGGAIYTSGVLSVSNCKFNNNQATRYGGSIYICSGASTTIKSSTFTNGYADVGGAMYNNGYSTTINSSTFTSNMATTGGSIYNKNYAKISDSTFTTNSAESGGALYNSNSGTKMIIDNTKFNNNTALYGGAIFNYKNANLNVTKTTFSYNQANNGEAVRNKNATATLTNNTITFTSDQQSNTIVTTDGKTTTNSIIYNRVNKLNATLNMAALMVVTGSSGTITGNITDANNKLITDSLTVTFSINGKNITTQTIKNGKINVSLSLGSYSAGVYNITTTVKESSNYLSTNATTVLMKDKKHSIVTSSVVGKNSETVTLTAYITNKNGTRASTGTATFKLNGVTIKDSKGNPIKVSIKNGVASYTYTIPASYSAKDYKLTAVADADGRIENTAKLTIEKTDQKLTAGTSMFVTGNTAQLTGTIVDVNGKTTTRDTKVAIKINGKTVTNTVVTNGKLDVKLDLSKYNSGAYTIDIVLGENGCYNTGYANMTLIKNMKNSIVVMPTNNTAGSNGTLYAFVTDSNGNRQSSGTVTFKIDGTTIGTGSINNGVANITYNTLQYYTGSHTLTVSTTVNGKTLTNSTTLRIKS